MNIGPTELIIVLVIVLLIFGPKRLPALAKSLGGGLREFKDSIGGKSGDDAPEVDAARPASAPQAQAALGRPGEPLGTATTGTASPEGEAVSERR